jgi:hypothetical protein
MNTTSTQTVGLFLALTFGGVVAANSQTIYSNAVVPANAEIYGAGNAGLPDAGGVLPVEFDLPAHAAVLSFLSVSGIITYNDGTGHNDADGVIVNGGYYGPTLNGTTGYSVAGSYGGISGITMPGAGALVGVFAPANAPTGVPPPSLDFTTIGIAFDTLSPALFQTFFIGDGRTSDGSGLVQQFNIPEGATRLFLGLSDAPGFDGNPGSYYDNFGSFTVSFQVVSVAPVQLQSPHLVGTNFCFSFQTVSNQSYTVLSTTNLAGGTWTTNTIFIGDGTFKQLAVPLSDGGEFFRVCEP